MCRYSHSTCMRPYACVWPHMSVSDGVGHHILLQKTPSYYFYSQESQPHRHIFAQNHLIFFICRKTLPQWCTYMWKLKTKNTFELKFTTNCFDRGNYSHYTVNIWMCNINKDRICTGIGHTLSLNRLCILRPILHELLF